MAVINPVTVDDPLAWHWLGEGVPLYLAKIPTIAYIAVPNYLLAGQADGGLDKLDKRRMYSEIMAFAKVIHELDRMPISMLKGM